ncbi:hypothetical protein [Pedobacter cryophilus]|uniref:Glycine zipper family protein n=1 Tax=Pedobacter cryophilus TaxID=2571271 RepID=A0A4U1BTP8_9SPHI|nr:hypothetical protein [Pedobacter cryophilus]TKB95969.1 hypothetical protein FA046_14950 [Pedobacter cryophilus]
MKINQLNQKPEIDYHLKLKELYLQFELLLSEIRKKEVPDLIIISINKDIEELNSIASSGNELRKILKKKQTGIIKLLEKELKLVPKNYYRNLWLALGMSVFGLPLGVAFGTIIGNMAFLGIGLPIGLAIGIAVGTGMDKKAFKEGRQLDLEIKY